MENYHKEHCYTAVVDFKQTFDKSYLIYVTYTFDAGNQYTPDWKNINSDGTFENLFYEWLKSTDLADVTTNRRDKIISDFGKETGDHITVVKYQSRYQNLLDLGD